MPLFAPVTHTVAFSIALCVEYVARGASHARPRVRFTPCVRDGDILRVVVVDVVESRDLGDIRAASQSAAMGGMCDVHGTFMHTLRGHPRKRVSIEDRSRQCATQTNPPRVPSRGFGGRIARSTQRPRADGFVRPSARRRRTTRGLRFEPDARGVFDTILDLCLGSEKRKKHNGGRDGVARGTSWKSIKHMYRVYPHDDVEFVRVRFPFCRLGARAICGNYSKVSFFHTSRPISVYRRSSLDVRFRFISRKNKRMFCFYATL